MHIQFIWEQFLLVKWLIKKKKKPSALCKLKEKKRTAIQMKDERREISRRRDGMKEKKTVWVIKTWCVSVKLSFPPARLCYTHICNFHFQTHTSILHLSVVWPRLFAQSQKNYRLTQLKMPPETLPPALPPNPILHIASWDIGTSG